MAFEAEMLPIFTGGGKGPSPNVDYDREEARYIWTGTERVTVLVLGVDERAQWDEPAWRTDTMMVATLDPVTMQAGLLSIPRDLWVDIPTVGYNRINTAHYFGDYYDYPGGGPALAAETVERNLGIAIDYYVRVNFQGFIDFVDAIGGIDIYVEETIDDPAYPDYDVGYDPLYIEAGQHHFYGDMALKYARTRHSPNGDFDRARRQQQVVQAVLDRVTDPARLPQLVSNAPEMYASVEDSVATDLKLDQMLALAMVAKDVNRDDIRMVVIDETATEPWVTVDDAMILVPVREAMRQKRDYFLGMTEVANPDPAEEAEEASITLLNGTLVSGLAGSTAQYLSANGLTVDAYANADRQDYDSSLVILNRDKGGTAQRIVELLGLPASAVVRGDNPTAEYDVVVILGQDYADRVALQE
jgi:LCP family protein required for cell wall assembly